MEVILTEQEAEEVQGGQWAHEDLGEVSRDTTQERALKEVRVVDLEEEEGSGGASVMLSEGVFLRVTGEVSVTIMEVILTEQEAEEVQGDQWALEDLGEGLGGEAG